MLIPEWVKPDAIALVWPQNLPSETGKLAPFYRSLIRLLGEHEQEILLIYKNEISKKPPENKWVKAETFEKISDIWIRDFGPLFCYGGNSILPYRFSYKPSYAWSEKELEWNRNNDETGNKLTDKAPEQIGITLDGGNFIHNSFGTAIVTNRIFSDNENLFGHEIREILEKMLGIKELHIVPSEPGDDTGHIDGLVRFIDPLTVAVSQYPYDYESDESSIPEAEYNQSRIVTDKIAEYLAKQGFNIIRIPNSIPREGVYPISCKCRDKKMFENATGNYTNFLRAGNKIFVPQYNNRHDDENALESLRKLADKKIEIIPVDHDATKLAEYGGVINCITSPLYGGGLTHDPFDPFIVVARENPGNKIFVALKKEGVSNLQDYTQQPVCGIDLDVRGVDEPNLLARISKHIEPVSLEFAAPEMQKKLNELISFPPQELRKLWKLFGYSVNKK